YPLLLEVLGVCRIDLAERAMSQAGVAARVGQPVLWFLRRAKQTVVGYLGLQADRSQRERHDGKDHASAHAYLPLSDTRYASRSPTSCVLNLSLYEGIDEVLRMVYSRRSALVSDSSRS